MHVAIIMDGNGRWAAQRRLPRSAGHRAGAKAVNHIVEAAARDGISVLSLYAFSAANWSRPRAEVETLFTLLRRHLLTQTQRCLEQSIRINVIGRRDRLDAPLLRSIERSESLTASGSRMLLRIAIDYSAQYTLMEVGRRMAALGVGGTANDSEAQFLSQLAAVDHAVTPSTEVDLLIRTGGEQRLSDFLLWEIAYAELHFTQRFWPDFSGADFAAALGEFTRRERRFGQVPAASERNPRSTGIVTRGTMIDASLRGIHA